MLTANGADLFAALVLDRDVRVSVKALALSCVGAAVALHPESFFSRLYRAPLDSVECPGEFTVCVSLLTLGHCFQSCFKLGLL